MKTLYRLAVSGEHSDETCKDRCKNHLNLSSASSDINKLCKQLRRMLEA